MPTWQRQRKQSKTHVNSHIYKSMHSTRISSRRWLRIETHWKQIKPSACAIFLDIKNEINTKWTTKNYIHITNDTINQNEHVREMCVFPTKFGLMKMNLKKKLFEIWIFINEREMKWTKKKPKYEIVPE